MGILNDIEPYISETDPGSTFIWLFGAAFSGKTTFAHDYYSDDDLSLGAGKCEHAILLRTEPGHKYMDWDMQVAITSWSEFKIRVVEIRDKKDELREAGIKGVIVDTADRLFKMTVVHMSSRGVDFHKEDFGRSSSQVTDEFGTGIITLANIGFGITFISHEIDKSVPVKGKLVTKMIPDLSKRARQRLDHLCDMTCRVVVEGSDDKPLHRIYVNPQHDSGAGTRINVSNFTSDEIKNGFDLNGRSFRKLIEEKLTA